MADEKTETRAASRKDPSKSPAPETVVESETRETPRTRQIAGGEIHWFNGARLARETR